MESQNQYMKTLDYTESVKKYVKRFCLFDCVQWQIDDPSSTIRIFFKETCDKNRLIGFSENTEIQRMLNWLKCDINASSTLITSRLDIKSILVGLRHYFRKICQQESHFEMSPKQVHKYQTTITSIRYIHLRFIRDTVSVYQSFL